MLRSLLQSARWVLLLTLAFTGARAAATVGSVVAVQPTRVADLVMLDAGFTAGLRQGMICRLTRGQAEIAEILIVELRSHFSAALIVSLSPREQIRPGDSALIKTFKT